MGSQVTASIGSTVIDCANGTVTLGTTNLVPVYNPTGNVVAMSRVPDNLPPPPISAVIPKGQAGRCSHIWKNLQSGLEDGEAEDYLEESEKGSDEEGGCNTE